MGISTHSERVIMEITRITFMHKRLLNIYKINLHYIEDGVNKIATEVCLGEDFKSLDEDTLLLNEMLSWLSHTLEEYPPWWNNNGWDLYDYNVVMEIWSKVLEFEKTFKSEIEKQGEKVEEKSK